MSKYAGTKTEANLRAAFAGEAQARNQYTFFASVAKKEGYEQMAALFLKTAENEKEHAKLWPSPAQYSIYTSGCNLPAKQVLPAIFFLIYAVDKYSVRDEGRMRLLRLWGIVSTS